MVSMTNSAVKQRHGPAARTAPLALHVLGGALGGTLLGAALGLVGVALQWLPPELLIFVAAGAGVADLVGRRLPEPTNGVPAAWAQWAPEQHMPAYGAVLGAGVFTPYSAASMYALVALVVLLASPGFGALVFGVYGVTRAAVSVLAGIAAVGSDVGTVQRALRAMKGNVRPALGSAALLAVAIHLIT